MSASTDDESPPKKMKNGKARSKKDRSAANAEAVVDTAGASDISIAHENIENNDSTIDEVDSKQKSKKAAAPKHQVLTQRDDLPKLWNANDHKNSYTFKIASWNVAGLRAVLKNHPHALSNLVQDHNLDVLMLQETKLQDIHVDDPKLKIRGHLLENEGYDAHYSCSTSKKGYSGTAVFVRRRSGVKGVKRHQSKLDGFFTVKKGDTASSTASVEAPIDVANLVPKQVTFDIGKDEHDKEGRVITLEFPRFSLTNVYVPNSGQKLERLDYRTKQWDKDFLAYHQKKNLPVIWAGDLNVAHTNLEVWNDGAKHLATQAGVTQQERDSFQAQLDSGFVDAFRKLHPEAKGHYTYWSQRAGNREPNKGLRLDYFICSPSFFDDNNANNVFVRDSYTLPAIIGSDHCPVVLELEIKK